MRKFVLIAAMVLVSATAQAGQSRSLTVATAEQPAASTQPAAAEPAKVQTAQTPEAATPAATTETPKYVERPAAVDTTTTTPPPPKADSGKPVQQTAKSDKPRHKKYWSEARIIGELHRHGIYW
jgi:hypothetical protein